ncbi:DUF4132 domain-containing protein [Janthinobacterium sp. FW305-129]|uniref:DUF4132 domain-containing protein n=1 Tax=Janthinobacterium sp. FW305-129 TaxID=2775054 RepID=UPI001E5C3731|nr:DUF4132 domain-containing protein [Janthinobacterium sp. FW305-129]MCC7599179.1 DUF4132 domain-containing protein [Janthinobacterium sp. FW305-129]
MNDTGKHVPGAGRAALERGLKGLANIDRMLWQDSCAFVLGGEHSATLQKLRQGGARTAAVLGHPGRLSHSFFATGTSDGDAQQARAGLVARDALYAAPDAGALSPACLVRLGKVLEAADHGLSFAPTGADVPDWLHYLVNDALFATRSQTRDEATADNRPAWDVRLVARLLEADGLSPGPALELVFERRRIAEHQLEGCLRRLLAPGALDDYMQERPEQVRALALRLSAQGRRMLAARLGSAPRLAGVFDDVLVRLAVDGSKAVRAAAAPFVSAMAGERQLALLGHWLLNGKLDERARAAELLGTDATPALLKRALLERALPLESGKAARQAIAAALARMDGPPAATDAPPPAPQAPHTVLGEEALRILLKNHDELLKECDAAARKEEAENRRQHGQNDYWQRREQQQLACGEASLRGVLRALNGQGDAADRLLLHDEAMRDTICLHGRLFDLADFGLRQLALWYGPLREQRFSLWNDQPFQVWLARQDPASVDLRTIDALLRDAGAMPDLVALAWLAPGWHGPPQAQHMLPADAIWPLFFEQPALVEQALGLSVARGDITLELAWTLELLELFPALPVRWRPRLMELALGEGKTYRLSAQRLLARVPGIGQQVSDNLDSGKQEVRSIAARWLAELGCRAAVPSLYQALERESRATVGAVLMAALETLGEDLSPRLSPRLLLAQAREGLRGKAPAGLSWFPFSMLPACAWRDGQAVEADIVRWWLVLACQLKQPGGNGLLARYLCLLAPASRAALGGMVLRTFIAHDERRGSAIGEKGMLALAAHAPGSEAVSLLQAYMRDSHASRAQIEAMLEALAGGDDPAVIQFLLGVAHRYRNAGVQGRARELVGQIAQRRGWSEEQLADRTVAMAGLDAAGRLELDYGGRRFYATLDPALKPVLQRADGGEIKTLPAACLGDDERLVQEARQALAACRKEVRQVAETQAARLYCAMCTGRVWPLEEWQRHLLGHPVVGRLAQRLVWQAQDDGGVPLQLLRPTEDGSLIGADDAELVLAPGSALRLAHAAILSGPQIGDWQRHLIDYKITPLFEQLQRSSPDAALLGGVAISDRLGWVSDAHALHAAFGKLGYQRTPADDGGLCDSYYKDFGAADLRVAIDFSGNVLPEKKLPAALKSLRFERLSGPRRQHAVVPAEVPGVLLAEAYGDYLAVAAQCAGFDAAWEERMPWQ